MNKYAGKICPYCKTVIKPNDEVVICSDCDMPHHKECWIDNQGCTTFGCSGTISGPRVHGKRNSEEDFEIIIYDVDFPQPQQFQYCPACGTSCRSDSAFCGSCGMKLRSSIQTQRNGLLEWNSNQDNRFSQEQVADVELLIGLNVDYYISRFNDMNRLGKKSSWNWSAFLVAPLWLAYRKMYGYGVWFLAGILLLSLLNSQAAYYLTTIMYILFGIFGNYVYLCFIEKKVRQIGFLSGHERSCFVAKNGGTSITAAILCAVGYVILAAIFHSI